MSKTKYTEEILLKAIELKLQGYLTKEIVEKTGIKKPSLDKLFKDRNIKLTPEQHKANTSRRWEGYEPPVINGKKECTGCSQWKILEDFHNCAKSRSGKKSHCKVCEQERYQENREEIIANVREYAENNKEMIAERNAENYAADPEKFKEKAKEWDNNNPEKRREITSRYGKKTQKAKNGRTAGYRAKKQMAMPSWLTDAQIEEIAQFWKNCPAGMHVDHIVPLNGKEVSGLHVPWNLRYLPARENEGKGNKLAVGAGTGPCHQYLKRKEHLNDDITSGHRTDLKVKDFILEEEKCDKEHYEFIKKYEWLGDIGNTPLWIFTARHEGKLAGVIFITRDYTPTTNGLTEKEALISRGACASWAPKNLNSRLVMFSCNWLVSNTEKRIFFGFSDHEAGEIGTIYQACNFHYMGSKFGCRDRYEGKEGEKTTSFNRTSYWKKCAKILGIEWKTEWYKNGDIKLHKRMSNIPKDIKIIIKAYINQEKSKLKKTRVPNKSKYVLILGKNKKEKKELTDYYRKIGIIKDLKYPKRGQVI